MSKFVYISATSIGTLVERLNEVGATSYKVLNLKIGGHDVTLIEVIAETEV